MFRCDICLYEREWKSLYRDTDVLFPSITVCVTCQPRLAATWRADAVEVEKNIPLYQREAQRNLASHVPDMPSLSNTRRESPSILRGMMPVPPLRQVPQESEEYPYFGIDDLTSYYHRWGCPDEALAWLRDLQNREYVIIDTETTGSRRYSQVIEIAILSKQGDLLFSSLLQPSTPIEPIATSVHGLAWRDVKDAPTFDMIYDEVYRCLQGKLVLAYNTAFDIRLLFQTARAFRVHFPRPEAACVMYCYSKVRNEKTPRRQYRRFSLGDACRHMHIEVPIVQFRGEQFVILSHRAKDDALYLYKLIQCLIKEGKSS